MCDISGFAGFLATADALLIGAMVSIGVAAALNNGFFTAAGSPAAMIVAGGLTLGAVGALAGASAYLDQYTACIAVPSQCTGLLESLRAHLIALNVVLGIQATACFVAAGVSWIPWVGQAPMWVILAALIVQVAVLASLHGFLGGFLACVDEHSRASSTGFTLIISAVVAAVVLATVGWGRNRWKARLR